MGKALTLKQVEVIGLSLGETWNGARVNTVLLALFVIKGPFGLLLVGLAALVEIGETFFWIHLSRRRKIRAGAETLIGARKFLSDGVTELASLAQNDWPRRGALEEKNAAMKKYIKDYNDALDSSKTALEFRTKITMKYPNYALERLIVSAADAAFPAAKP